MLKRISKKLEKRKLELNKLLKRENLTNETKHQIKGAINEIEIVLRLLEDYRYFEMEEELKKFKLIKFEEKGFISRLFSKKNLINGKNSKDITQGTY